MKLVALWLAVVAFAAAGSCSVSHRSGDFACTDQAQCSANRICVDGFCVSTVPPDAAIDAPAPRDAASLCPSQCTSCDVKARSCAVDCAVNPDLCNAAVTCPAGWTCDIACSTSNSCRNGVDCADATSCAVTCSGTASCRTVTCGSGRCNVECSGGASCRQVDCGTACACDVTCLAGASCFNVACTSPACLVVSPGGRCSSLNPGCDTCP